MSGTHNFYDDVDDEDTFDPSGGDLYDPTAPLLGCACENPLSVDTVCEGCAAYLEEQHAEIERDRLARASAFSIEECVYWLSVAWSRGYPLECGAAICFAVERNEEGLREEADAFLSAARLYPHAHLRCQRRYFLTAWALCREALRAIERERRP
jgi:hypothetical protein